MRSSLSLFLFFELRLLLPLDSSITSKHSSSEKISYHNTISHDQRKAKSKMENTRRSASFHMSSSQVRVKASVEVDASASRTVIETETVSVSVLILVLERKRNDQEQYTNPESLTRDIHLAALCLLFFSLFIAHTPKTDDFRH